MSKPNLNPNQIEDKSRKVVRDALRITNILNKHLLDDCPHCKQLVKEFEFE